MSEEEMKNYLKEMAKYDENINGDDIIAINGALELIDKQQKEIENKNKVIDYMKEKLNNISFEVETGWRKIEKLENKDE